MKARRAMQWLAVLACAALPACGRAQGPVPVRLERAASGWKLMRGGQAYPIRGAGGSGSLEALKAAGGNTMRTWSVDGVGPLLDRAHSLGLTVTAGIWMGHERHGFKYSDEAQVARQLAAAREAVLRHKDHPALLMWAVGNEMEGDGSNEAVWAAVDGVAAMIKKADPNHPTMTVIAEVGGSKVRSLHRLCPNIDIVGINAYGGAPTVGKRYREAGGEKPYVLTEFGPNGMWEAPKTAWGAPIEPSSTAKEAAYRAAWQGSVAGQPLCLGGYAFNWGHKQEATATWFGLLLPDGSRTGPVDVLAELWTGKPPADRCPAIRSLTVTGGPEADPGATLTAALDASDPEGATLRVEWLLQGETARYGTGGDAEAAPSAYPEAIVQGDARGATVKLPVDPGNYRLYATVRDGSGGAATVNIPLKARGEVVPRPGARASLPLVVYDEPGCPDAPFAPTGWMGASKEIKADEAWADRPRSGKACLRFDYYNPGEWAGVVWQHPYNDWGDRSGGYDLTGARALVFWARGAKGGEVVSFQFGLLGADKRFPDTARGALDRVALTSDWKEYRIPLDGKDLSRIKTGFCWVAGGQGGTVTFFLDDIRFE